MVTQVFAQLGTCVAPRILIARQKDWMAVEWCLTASFQCRQEHDCFRKCVDSIQLRRDFSISLRHIIVWSHRSVEGQEQPIAFTFRTLSSSERNYPKIEKEALSLIFGVIRFHLYLYGQNFLLLAGHHPLVTIIDPKTGISPIAAMRSQHWTAVLSAYT